MKSNSVIASHSTEKIVPTTSRHAIIHNASSIYRNSRKCRVKQLRSLNNEILNDDKEWRKFHFILQQKRSKTGITNATVKALLFDALESFQSKNSQNVSDILAEPNQKISQPDDITSSEAKSINESTGCDVRSESMNLPSDQDSSLSTNCPKRNILSNHTAKTELVVANVQQKIEKSFQIIVLKKLHPEYEVFGNEKQSLLFVDSISEDVMNSISKLETRFPIHRRQYRPVNLSAMAA